MDEARISFCVDTMAGAELANRFFAEHNTQAEVLIEVDTGYGRCGERWDVLCRRSVRGRVVLRETNWSKQRQGRDHQQRQRRNSARVSGVHVHAFLLGFWM